jgi:hypothetical protein
MNRKINTAAAIALLAAAGLAGYQVTKKDPPSAAGRSAEADRHDAPVGARTSPESETREEGRQMRGTRRSGTEDYADLSAKYGASRTRRAKHLASKITSLLEDTISTAEFLHNATSSPLSDRPMMIARADPGGVDTELALTAEQNAKFAGLFDDFHRREMAKSKATLESLKKDKVALMTALLASDAHSRNEMPDADFQKAQSAIPSDIKHLLRHEGALPGGRILSDPEFVREYRSILTPAQAEAHDARATVPPASAGQAAGQAPPPSQSLETLEQSVEATRKRIQGLNMMMEGLKQMNDPDGPMMVIPQDATK